MFNLKIKKIILLTFCAASVSIAQADTDKSQLLSSMTGGSNSSNSATTSTPQPQQPTSSAPGGLVNNNVNYNSGGNSSQPSQQINLLADNSSSGNNYNNRTNSNSNKSSQPKKVYKKTAVKKQVVKKVNISEEKIDVVYFGDVSGVPNLITQYFPEMKVASPLGRPTNQNVSFDMQNVTISDISSMIQSLTTGNARLIYNSNQNTIRVSYVTTNNSMSPTAQNKLSPEQQSANWRAGKGKPRPIMSDSGVLLFPYGQYEPTVICKPQQVCDIQFQAGEVIQDAVMGDTSRWIVQGVVSGVGSNAVQHIILKPIYPDLATNMIVTTKKGRTYNINLVSSDKNYVSAVSWYYPQEINNKMMQDFNAQQQSLGENNGVANIPASGYTNQGLASTANGLNLNSTPAQPGTDELPALNLDFRYKVKGDDVVWKPTRVFNDGVHTYIEVNPKALNQPSPAFVVYEPYSGQYEMVNYRQKGNYMIVDQVFNQGALIYDVGYNQQKVEIIHFTDPNKENKNWLY